jgi:DNA-directed RNA polymerase specialized sigma24 family protein
MASEGSVTRIIALVKGGNHPAAQVLWEAYFLRVVEMAHARLRSRKGEGRAHAVAGSVLETLLRRAAEGRFPDLNDRDDLWRLLVVLTIRKAINLYRREKGRQRHEVLFSELPDPAHFEAEIGDGPRPKDFFELWSELMACLDREPRPEKAARLNQVAELKLEGFTQAEVARRIGVSEITVRRDLHCIRELWVRRIEEQGL